MARYQFYCPFEPLLSIEHSTLDLAYQEAARHVDSITDSEDHLFSDKRVYRLSEDEDIEAGHFTISPFGQQVSEEFSAPSRDGLLPSV